ncbi:NAD(P)-dependent oxidoreductase [Actinocrispum wychmicini]|nr:NAD(P)-dependent oxidoreductase [Actinocrispum wychmicini]
MKTIGVLSPGAMGSAVGGSLRAGGRRVITTLAGRSARSARFAEEAGLELVPDIDAVVSEADVVLSIVPPESAVQVASALAASIARTGRQPIVAELNAIAPSTLDAIAGALDIGVDGSISGPPPRPDTDTRIFLSGPAVAELAELPAPGIRWITVGSEIGAASAVKMCTGSVYKGLSALLAHALLTADRHGVTSHVLDDVTGLIPNALWWPVQAATKAWRFVGEMEQISAAQAEAGLTPALFDGMAEVYRKLATSEWGGRQPEDVPKSLDASAVADLRPS